MARKPEAGLKYFPMNTDIVFNQKVKLVVAEFGPKAWAVLLPLYCKIYREKGYWIDWHDEDAKLLFAKDECQLELSLVNEVVNGCIRRGLFDKAVFESFGILTSDRIQENYFEGKNRSKDVVVFEEFICENVEIPINVNINQINADTNCKKVDTSTQKKRKENKRKENTHALKSDYENLQKDSQTIYHFIKNNRPPFIEPYRDAWNLFAKQTGKPEVKAITEIRRKHFLVRVGEPQFDFLKVLSTSRKSDFLMTSSFFTFDWIIQNTENYLKVLEGKYDNAKTELKQKNESDIEAYKRQRAALEERSRQIANQ